MLKRILLTLIASLLPLSAVAQTAIVYNAAAASGPYCIIFDDTDNTKADFVEGTGSKAGRFTITDAALVTASLDAGNYTGRVFANTAASLVVATDALVGDIADFEWDGTADETIRDAIAAIDAGVADPVSPDIITRSRTWFAVGRRAQNIVEVTAGFVGTFALMPDLNTATTINTVSAVSITGAATVTATNLSVDRSLTQAHFTVPALSTVGTYTVVVTVTTVDGQTIKTTGTLKVY